MRRHRSRRHTAAPQTWLFGRPPPFRPSEPPPPFFFSGRTPPSTEHPRRRGCAPRSRERPRFDHARSTTSTASRGGMRRAGLDTVRPRAAATADNGTRAPAANALAPGRPRGGPGPAPTPARVASPRVRARAASPTRARRARSSSSVDPVDDPPRARPPSSPNSSPCTPCRGPSRDEGADPLLRRAIRLRHGGEIGLRLHPRGRAPGTAAASSRPPRPPARTQTRGPAPL